jgi:CRP/FNR family transcriptional regulator, cyclic AMP receptor protein
MDPNRLKDISLFQGLSRKELQDVGTWTDEIDVPAGQHLAEQGSFAYEFFVIEEGTAEVTQDGKTISSLGPGDFFGEIALLETERRTASVVATSAMRLIVMTSRDFRTMESKMPHVAEQVRKRIEERLARDRESN